MTITSILLTGADRDFPQAVREAAQHAFPSAPQISLSSLTEALALAPGCGGELLLLAGPAAAEHAAAAASVMDADHLPRWTVLHLGNEGDAILPEECTVRQLTRLFREAAARHGLTRENARLRGDLLTMARRVSHDLRTPLGGIIAIVDMLTELYPAEADTTRPLFASVDEITKIITRTGFLLKATAQPLPKTTLNMGSLVNDVIMRLERPIALKSAIIHQPDTWPDVRAVGPWLEIIWWNLIHNALQHSGTPLHITLGWEPENGGHRFFIRDSGQAGTMALPVPSFHLLHDPNAPKGLGLSIIRRLTELQGGHCGTLTESSTTGFFFYLPGS